jgi:zinc transporter 5/7
MDFTDARTRKKVTLNPRTVLSNSWVNLIHDYRTEPIASYYRVSGRVATDIVFSNALLAVSLWTVKEWFLSQNVGAFWVLMRVLACGALGLSLRRAEGLGNCVISEGTHLFFLSRLTEGVHNA